jgi:hypothetical protein
MNGGTKSGVSTIVGCSAFGRIPLALKTEGGEEGEGEEEEEEEEEEE